MPFLGKPISIKQPSRRHGLKARVAKGGKNLEVVKTQAVLMIISQLVTTYVILYCMLFITCYLLLLVISKYQHNPYKGSSESDSPFSPCFCFPTHQLFSY